jgi:hypothetical protein
MKNEGAVLFVKFKSTHSPDQLNKISRDDLEIFRNVHGLLQKYYISEEVTGAFSGFYIFESKSARSAFWTSELAKRIPVRYGIIPESLRVEEYELVVVLDETEFA